MTQPDMATRKWTAQEVDGLVFRLVEGAYKKDGKTCRFIIQHLREALWKELT